MKDEYRYLGKGWNGKKYYIEMTREEMEERQKLHLFLSVITVTPALGIIMALVAGVI